MKTYRRKYTSQLPSTPVTVTMRERVVSIAQERGMSLSEVQREALSLFLAKNDSKKVKDDSKSVKEESQDER